MYLFPCRLVSHRGCTKHYPGTGKGEFRFTPPPANRCGRLNGVGYRDHMGLSEQLDLLERTEHAAVLVPCHPAGAGNAAGKHTRRTCIDSHVVIVVERKGEVLESSCHLPREGGHGSCEVGVLVRVARHVKQAALAALMREIRVRGLRTAGVWKVGGWER